MNKKRIFLAALFLATVLSAALYLGNAALHVGHLGFPLDDAWIFQTYARNLARYGELSYYPGHPSSGSTGPLWTIMVSAGYFLGLDFRLWTYILGGCSLVLTGIMACLLSLRLFPEERWASMGSGLFCALEWHLVWAAFSGMETALFTALSLALLERYLAVAEENEPGRSLWPFLGLGLLGGLLTLTRPEGAVLFGLIGLGLLGRWLSFPARRLLPALLISLGFALLIAPYLAYNLRASGLLFPNTFYAKQREYAVLLEMPFPARLWRVFWPTIVGGQVLLLPGFVLAGYKTLRGNKPQRFTIARWPANRNSQAESSSALKRTFKHALACLSFEPEDFIFRLRGAHKLLAKFSHYPIIPLIWWAAFFIIYAVRLPVNYQHGRYLIPTIPVLIIYGMAGTTALVRLSRLARLFSQAGLGAIGATLLLFWAFLGPRAYAADVGFIEGEMVNVARWLNENTPEDALIAVHDIGAIGYYTERPLLDLAGLITPEVIPFIRDEERLLSFIAEKGADYLVTFPSWYPRLVQDLRLRPVYCTNYAWSVQAGADNMFVYEARWEDGE
ncbi:MAG: hypothetical protein ACUVV0_07430 [Anaerolineae bacterium]